MNGRSLRHIVFRHIVTYRHIVICALVVIGSMGQIAAKETVKTVAAGAIVETVNTVETEETGETVDMGERVEALLKKFDERPTAENANAFFGYLYAEGWLLEPMTIAYTEHRDSICGAVWYWAGEWYYDRQNYTESERYCLMAYPLCKSAGDKIMEADCASLLSIVYVRQGKFDKAAVYAKCCNELDIESGDKDNIASSYNTLAGIYMSANEAQVAEKYILKAIEYVEQTDNEARKAVVYGMAGEVYQNMRDLENSLKYASRALEIERESGRVDRIAIRQAQRASSLLGMKRYDEAREALEEAIPVLRQMNNAHSLGIACVQMGDVLHKQKQDSLAIKYYDEASEIFEAQHDLYNLSQAHDGLREAWRDLDPLKALEHNDKFLILQDSLYDKETGELLSKYAAEYDNWQLKNQNAAQQDRYRTRILLTIGGFGVLLIILIVVVTIYYRNNKKGIAVVRHELDDVRKALLASKTVTQVEDKNAIDDGAGGAVFLKRVVEEVESSLESGEYNVETIAGRLGMSVRTFRRKIQESTGGTPKDFICAIQMEKARRLLLNDIQMKIEDVATQCGFEDASSFTHTFNRIFGMSPTQFRKQNMVRKH